MNPVNNIQFVTPAAYDCSSRLSALLAATGVTAIAPFTCDTDVSDYIRKLCTKAEIIIVIDANNGQDIGIAAFYANDIDGGRAFLTTFGLVAAYRSTGLASMLMNEVAMRCVRKGMRWLDLQVHTLNARAIKFYIRNGFRTAQAMPETVYKHMTKCFY